MLRGLGNFIVIMRSRVPMINPFSSHNTPYAPMTELVNVRILEHRFNRIFLRLIGNSSVISRARFTCACRKRTRGRIGGGSSGLRGRSGGRGFGLIDGLQIGLKSMKNLAPVRKHSGRIARSGTPLADLNLPNGVFGGIHERVENNPKLHVFVERNLIKGVTQLVRIEFHLAPIGIGIYSILANIPRVTIGTVALLHERIANEIVAETVNHTETQ